MSTNLILDFPILKKDSGDFLAEISYEVEACQSDGKLIIRHTIKGQSFVSQLLKTGDAKFSALLLYRDSSERQHRFCDADTSAEGNEINATQTIPIKFSYAPEITPSIVILKNKKISVDASSGLTDFWGQGEHFEIPPYSRIALGQKLKFTSGGLSKLMKIIPDENLNQGEMKVNVNEHAGEGETPVSLYCGQGVFDELHKITEATLKKPRNAAESMRSAILTQALCAVYAYMKNLDEDYESSGVLAKHLEMLESETGENWEDENFNPSLAATKMQPYTVKALNGGNDDD